MNIPTEWKGDIPVFLMIVRSGFAVLDDETIGATSQHHVIDLDERGWLETYKELLRGESTWHLVDKASSGVCFSMIVREGEQPYYTARHFARADGSNAKASAYGIGKKRLDGHVDRLWIFYPSGQVCVGDDVDLFGRAALAQL